MEERIQYSDGDIVVGEGLDSLGSLAASAGKSRDKILIVLCSRGGFVLEMNGRPENITRGDILICPPEVSIGRAEEAAVSDDEPAADVKVMGICYSSLRSSLLTGRSVWSAMMYVRNNPVIHLNDHDLTLTELYYSVIRQKIGTVRDFYYKEIMQSLLLCALYELCVVINREIAPGADDNRLSRRSLLFKQFVELLAASDCRDRSVAHFADRLCVTPKYLAAAVKTASGRNASDLILENAGEAIRHELLYSGKSIKEIAAEFDFPSVSGFGKFCRSRLGLSPRAYRMNRLV